MKMLGPVGYITAFLALSGAVTMAQADQGTFTPPDAAAVNDAMARSPEYKGEAVADMLGCFPLAMEEGVIDPKTESYYCGATPKPANEEEPLSEFAIGRLKGAKRFDMWIGEYAGACPPAKDIAAELEKHITVKGVTGLIDAADITLGGLTRGEDGKGPLMLACSYLGKLGDNNYQLTVPFSYDASGYHLTGKGEEEVFDNDGNLVPDALHP